MRGFRTGIVGSVVLVAGIGFLRLGARAFGKARRKGGRPTPPADVIAMGPVRDADATDATRRDAASLAAPQPGSPSPRGPVRGGLSWMAGHRFLLGVVATLAVSGTCGLAIGAWLYEGGFDTASSKPHHWLVAEVTHGTMIHSVKKRAEAVHAPDSFTPEQVLAGAKLYEEHCIACHGGAAVARAPWAATMTPTPPFVIDSARNWSKRDFYIILQQGVKMSAMPAWGEILSDDELWDIVSFLEAMPNLSPADYARLRAQIRAQPTTPMDTSGPNASLSPQPLQDTQPLDRAVTPGGTSLPFGYPTKQRESGTRRAADQGR